MEAAEKQLDTIGHIAFGMVALSFLVAMESLWGPVQLSPVEATVLFWGLNGSALLLCVTALWYFHTPKPRPTPQPRYPGRVTITPVDEDEETIPLLPPGYDSFNDDPTEWL